MKAPISATRRTAAPSASGSVPLTLVSSTSDCAAAS